MRKIAFSALLGLSLVAALAGCGGGNDDTDPDPTPTPTPTPTPAPGGSGRIVFQLGPDIYIMHGDGTGRTQVTDPTNGDQHLDPDLSPDGTQITFVRDSNESDDYQVMLVNADGTNMRTLTAARRYTRMPRWSPDGSKIIYGAGSSKTGLYTINPDGTNETWFEAAGEGALPEWSLDGSKITFCSDRAGTGMDIYTINLDGTGLTRITNTPDYIEWNPRYSPDGTKLVCYSGNSLPSKQIAVMNADGTNRALIGPEIARRPTWTPDGTKILLATPIASGSNTHNLFTINPDGSNLVNLTNSNTSAHESNPSY